MKKHKTYHTNYDSLSVAWVNGDITAEAHTAKNRMFCSENAIYSYGSHFCVARRWIAEDTGKEWFLLTERRFSNTTSLHQQSVFWAIPEAKKVMLPQVDDIAIYGLKGPTMGSYIPADKAKSTEADLGQLVLSTENDRACHYVQRVTRMLRPYPEESVQRRFDVAEESIKRFGLAVPEAWKEKRESTIIYCHRRAERNAILDFTAEAKRRLAGVR